MSAPVGDAAVDAAEAWRRMRALVLDNERRQEVCSELGLSFSRIRALCQLAGGPRTMGELAAALGTDAPYVSVVVHDLERRGLVQRSRAPGDGRIRLVGLSHAGAALAARARALLDCPPAALAALAPSDLAALVGVLRRVAPERAPDA